MMRLSVRADINDILDRKLILHLGLETMLKFSFQALKGCMQLSKTHYGRIFEPVVLSTYRDSLCTTR